MYFTIQIIERNFEQEYEYNFLIKAGSLEEAGMKARFHVETWYDDPDVSHDVQTNIYEFFGGGIIVTYTIPVRTTKKAFAEMLTERYTIE